MKYFITFEGIDGSGKSTISKMVYKQLKSRDYEVVWTYEPTDTWLGKRVQQCIQNDEDPFVTVLAFISDRIQHGKQIEKWLDEGNIVLCDRYAESTYAYQGAQLQGLIKNPIKWLQELSKDRIPVPERTYLFIIEPKQALARIQKRETLIPFEKISFLEKVQRNYIELTRGKRFLKVDATKSKEELVQTCLDDILS